MVRGTNKVHGKEKWERRKEKVHVPWFDDEISCKDRMLSGAVISIAEN